MKEYRDKLRLLITEIFHIDLWILEDPQKNDEGVALISAIETPIDFLYKTDYDIRCQFAYIIKFRFSRELAYHDLPLHEIEEIAIRSLGKLGFALEKKAKVEVSISDTNKDWIISITLDIVNSVSLPDEEEDESAVKLQFIRLIMRSNKDQPPEIPAYDKTYYPATFALQNDSLDNIY